MTTTKRIGRPPKKPENLRTTGILVKMTPTEHAAIMQLARQTGRRAGEIMRTGALQKAKRLGIRTPVRN